MKNYPSLPLRTKLIHPNIPLISYVAAFGEIGVPNYKEFERIIWLTSNNFYVNAAAGRYILQLYQFAWDSSDFLNPFWK